MHGVLDVEQRGTERRNPLIVILKLYVTTLARRSALQALLPTVGVVRPCHGSEVVVTTGLAVVAAIVVGHERLQREVHDGEEVCKLSVHVIPKVVGKQLQHGGSLRECHEGRQGCAVCCNQHVGRCQNLELLLVSCHAHRVDADAWRICIAVELHVLDVAPGPTSAAHLRVRFVFVEMTFNATSHHCHAGHLPTLLCNTKVLEEVAAKGICLDACPHPTKRFVVRTAKVLAEAHALLKVLDVHNIALAAVVHRLARSLRHVEPVPQNMPGALGLLRAASHAAVAEQYHGQRTALLFVLLDEGMQEHCVLRLVPHLAEVLDDERPLLLKHAPAPPRSGHAFSGFRVTVSIGTSVRAKAHVGELSHNGGRRRRISAVGWHRRQRSLHSGALAACVKAWCFVPLLRRQTALLCARFQRRDLLLQLSNPVVQPVQRTLLQRLPQDCAGKIAGKAADPLCACEQHHAHDSPEQGQTQPQDSDPRARHFCRLRRKRLRHRVCATSGFGNQTPPESG
eukprot:Rhum_TRINITY_DN7597_c0_g2::Rhum_TRINITY_DN7597_c0_g2_i1::g.23660::m.23660